MSIRTTIIRGETHTTIDEGEWTFHRVGWSGWTATHQSSDTKVDTGQLDIADARRFVLEGNPALGADLAPAKPVGYSLQTGRTSRASIRGRRPQRTAGEVA